MGLYFRRFICSKHLSISYKLSKEQKQQNSQLASLRIVIEHIYRNLKIFRILSERYRNRKKRFNLRFNLIAAIYNYELYLT